MSSDDPTGDVAPENQDKNADTATPPALADAAQTAAADPVTPVADQVVPEPVTPKPRRKRGKGAKTLQAAQAAAGAPEATAASSEPPQAAQQPAVAPGGPAWTPSEDDIESKDWTLQGVPDVPAGLFDEVYLEAIRARAKGQEVTIMSPGGHGVPQQMESHWAMAARRARRWSVELQTGGVREVLAKGTFGHCVPVFEKHEKTHKAGTLAFLDPSGGAFVQRVKPMFRTTVTTPNDRDHIQLDEESYKRFLDTGEPVPTTSQAPDKRDQPAEPAPAPPPPTPAPVQEPIFVPAAVGAPVMSISGELLFEVQVLERILSREREEMIARAAAGRSSTQQMEQVARVMSRLSRGGGS